MIRGAQGKGAIKMRAMPRNNISLRSGDAPHENLRDFRDFAPAQSFGVTAARKHNMKRADSTPRSALRSPYSQKINSKQD